MRLANSSRLGLLLVFPLAGAAWFGGRLSPDPKPQEKPAEEPSLAQFVYPGSKSYKDYPKAEQKITEWMGKYTTGDAPEKVIKWYLKKLGIGGGDGMSREVGNKTSVRHDVIHDYANVGPEKDPRPVTVWIATRKVLTDKQDFTLNVVVTRGKDEPLTHIALSFLPGPQTGKK
jgi:hypothetical protein